MTFAWTDARIDELKQLWADGLSAKEIAEELGTTKGSIVGKVNRLGLPERASPFKHLEIKFDTREAWLLAFVAKARPHFDRVGLPLPAKIRVSVGFPSKGQRSKVIGECWQNEASQDKAVEIFIRPSLQSTTSRIAGVLTHELVHAAGVRGHDKAFRKPATALGLTGKMTATEEGPEWHEWADPIVKELGAFPGAALNGALLGGKKKQTTRMLKLVCNECGWTARASSKHIEAHDYLSCPVPQCSGDLHQDD